MHLRGIGKNFPFYGEIETEPAKVWVNGLKPGEFVIEQSLAEQFQLSLKGKLQVGDLKPEMTGLLTTSPPRASLFASFAPQVLIPIEDIAKTGLLTKRSLAFHRVYIKLPSGTNVQQLAESLEPEFKALRLSWQTPEKRRQNIGKQLDRLYRFLSLIGLASVILGGIGISSAIHQHISRRLPSIAILRCLGSPVRDAFGIYLIQAVLLGLMGCLVGACLGVGIQAVVPRLLETVSPLELTFAISWQAILLASIVSLAICLCFSCLPLLKIRRVPPLAAIRSALLQTVSRHLDPWAILINAILLVTLVGFSLWQNPSVKQGFIMAGGLIGVFLLLGAVGKLAVMASRRLVRPWWPFSLRQGAANLHRPHNQTLAVLLSLGMGVFLILTLMIVQQLLLDQLDQDRLANKGNLFLLDVQPEQQQGVEEALAAEGAALIQKAPLISMRLTHIKGHPVTEIAKEKDSKVPGWILRRDFRCTYRSKISDSEKIVDGPWIEAVGNYDMETAAPISLEQDIAKDMGVGIGDELIMDVQGLPLTLRVVNLREVNWGSMGLNFFIVFPEGILEDALSYYVYTTFAEDASQSAGLQTRLAKTYSNVSVIDLTLVVEMLEGILQKVALAIRFMAAFTILTGVLILIATLISGRAERVREMALLRTLGASNRQILQALMSEYLLLGLLASITGAVLALAASWPLAIFVFDTPFHSSIPLVLAVMLGGSLATLLLGLLLSRGVSKTPPLEVLRQA